jgi:23S rRNA (adenine2030-N6)-methyltransferase
MLSYQHGFHAGNFADVIKHLALTRILNYMINKEKPIFYLETHAGRGLYDLKSSQAVKTGEYRQGISLLWQERKHLAAVFSPYLQCISQVNEPEELRFYPGSPCLAIDILRKQDRLFLYELHPREFSHLHTLPRKGKRVFYEQNDGINNLLAKLPPLERRGLIFIDPSYELKTDYKQVSFALKKAYSRFATGIYYLWYPLIDKRQQEQLLRNIKAIESNNTLRIEFYLGQKKPGMQGCGLWIINPPYCLANEMKTALQQLCTLLNPGDSTFLIEH